MVAIDEQRGYRARLASLYPPLRMLENGAFVTTRVLDGERVYTITGAGSALLADLCEKAADLPDFISGAPRFVRLPFAPEG